MAIGAMRQRVSVETNTPTADDSGDLVASWAEYVAGWARVATQGAREFVSGQRVQAEETHLFVMRYRDGVTPKMRVSWDSRYFDIQAVTNPDQRKRYMHLLTREVVSA